MKSASVLRALAAAFLFVYFLTAPVWAAGNTPEYKISGPYTSENLSIYLLHGKDQIQGKTILTLQEAIAQKKVRVHETGDVNELAIENTSNDLVFVQSGDIVRGGRQDRTLQNDMLLQPRSGKIPLPSFCVEHGRWSGRGSESDAVFQSSHNALAGKGVKLAAKASPSVAQSSVWAEVEAQQAKLSRKLSSSVKDSRSESSFELSLENAKLKDATNAHVKKFSDILSTNPDAIGYAFAINGKLNSADIYASNALFKKLWPKLLKSNAVEAIGDKEDGKVHKAPAVAAVQSFLTEAADAKEQTKSKTKAGYFTEQENKRAISSKIHYLDSYSAKPASGEAMNLPSPSVVHQNIIAK